MPRANLGISDRAYLRISKDFLDECARRRYVRRCVYVILGTQIEGKSQTDGQTRLILEPNDNRIALSVEIIGTVHSQTVGHNGRAMMNYLSASTFHARKEVRDG